MAPKPGDFESFGLSAAVLRGVKCMGYRVPTPIQSKAMHLLMSGSDVVATARTGSGKTAAFLVAMLDRLAEHVPQAGVRALILSPTRDMALHTTNFAKKLGKFTDLRISSLVDGDSMELSDKPDIIITTPDSLMQHLSEVDDMSFRKVEYVVLDEADSVLNMGFTKHLYSILSHLSENRQTLLFSVTLPNTLAAFAKAVLRDPLLVRTHSETTPDHLNLTFFTVRPEEKYAAVLYLIKEQICPDEQTLVFVNTQHHVEFLGALFREEGVETSICYSKMDCDAMTINVSKFRAKETMVMIATDVGLRGYDIPLLDNVINWGFPPRPRLFVDRVGRVARAVQTGTGTVYSLVTSKDMPCLYDLHRFLSKMIKAAPPKLVQGITNSDTIYASIPQRDLCRVSDRIRRVIDSSAELTSLLEKRSGDE